MNVSAISEPKSTARLPVADGELLGGQIAGRRAQREREEDGQPVERLALRRDDRVDRERPLARSTTRRTSTASAMAKNVVVVGSATP